MRTLVCAVLLCASSGLASVRVAATTGDLAALAREVGGDRVDVVLLSAPTEDPHFVDAKPSRVLQLSRADLLVFNGMELEIGWLPVLLTQSRNGKLQAGEEGNLDCSTLVQPKEIPLQKIDRSMGDIHPGGNPHYTKDPENGVLVARGIANRLETLDQAGEAAYRANLAAFEQRMKARIADWKRALTPYKGLPVVTYHKSWIYFTEWAGLDEVAFIEPKPGIPPNPAHVSALFGVIKGRKVPIIIQEEWYPSATSDLLARNTGVRVVKVAGMARPGQTYADYIGTVVEQVVRGLAGKS